jgi:hypothetical protein
LRPTADFCQRLIHSFCGLNRLSFIRPKTEISSQIINTPGTGEDPPTQFGARQPVVESSIIKILCPVFYKSTVILFADNQALRVSHFLAVSVSSPQRPRPSNMSTNPTNAVVEKHGLRAESEIKQGGDDLKIVPSTAAASIAPGGVDDVIIDTINAETEYTPEQFKKLRWKIDLWLLPLMWVCSWRLIQLHDMYLTCS